MTIDKAKLKAAAVDWGNHAMEIPAPEVLALIAEIERLEADCRSMRGSLAASAKSTKKLIRDGSRAARERDQLKAELAGLRTGFDAQNEVIAGLKAECELFRLAGESLSEDVKRLNAENEALRSTCARASAYMDRWAGGYVFDADGPGGRIRGELYDAYRPGAREGIAKLHDAIDAARAKENPHG